MKKRFHKSLTSDVGLLLTKIESREMSSVTGLTSNLLECTPSVMNSSKWTQMRIQICKLRKREDRSLLASSTRQNQAHEIYFCKFTDCDSFEWWAHDKQKGTEERGLDSETVKRVELNDLK